MTKYFKTQFLSIIFFLMISTINTKALERNINIITKNNNKYHCELVDINDTSVIVNSQSMNENRRYYILKKNISKIYLSDYAVVTNPSIFEIYSKTFVKTNYRIKGIDMERNVLYIDSTYRIENNLYKHKIDSVDLSDTNIVYYYVGNNTQWFGRIVQGSVYGLGSGAIIGGVYGIFIATSHEFFPTVFGLGILGGGVGLGIGLVAGILYVVSEYNNYFIIKQEPEIKNILLNVIYFPKIEYSQD